ncbi:MFS general substrate transporter [Periconia macrospinosa]|uniref:MFS general substrate transporter n=1 Tax=Periconia macrospinosa TaxID=97972 RepID=A0A2V1E7E4_9PLEO|nr:MFS general substrate transporter [Periconia macrospinosa]
MSAVATTTISEAIPLEPYDAKHTPIPHKSTIASTPRTPSQAQSSISNFGTPDDERSIALAQTPPPPLSKSRLFLTIFQPSLINFFFSFTNGVITVGLPLIARDVHLPRSLYLWPSSVYGLTSGSMLLIAGAIADIIGVRGFEIFGVTFLGIFTVACGLANTGIQLVVFRAMQGFGTAIHLPSSVALVAAAVPSGKARNIGFACLGLSQPLGFSVGLVASGIMVETIGWRAAFYIAGGAKLVAAAVAFWALPKVKRNADTSGRSVWKQIGTDVDWIGGLIASGGLALLSYVLAVLSADLSTIRSAGTASLLAVSLVLLLAFPFWMRIQERAGRPALIPNSIWKNFPFTSTCIMVALSYGVMNAVEIFSSLYFQEVQSVSTQTTSLYLLPNLITGVLINLSVGIFVDRIPAKWLVSSSAIICAASPLMMALVPPSWKYWYLQFWAQIFAPFSGDVLFTVGLIIVSDNFPEKTQALAGAVFNTVAQFGSSLGIGVCQVVALGVMGDSGSVGHGGGTETAFDDDPTALLNGYRAAFWTMFGYMIICAVIAVVGLRKAGKVGLKKE